MKTIKYLVLFLCLMAFSAQGKGEKDTDFSQYQVDYYNYGNFWGDFKGKYKIYQGWESHGAKQEIVRLRLALKRDGRILNYQKIRKSEYFEGKYSIYFIFVN